MGRGVGDRGGRVRVLSDRLKRRLLPAWNGAHRLCWRAGEYTGAVLYGRFGRCDVCGRFGPWLYRRRVIPPRLEQLWGLSPRLAEALARKESSDCAWCGAKLRARRLARAILEAYTLGGSPLRTSPSVAEWVCDPAIRGLCVAEINKIEGLHEQLVRLPGLVFSDYDDASAPGLTSTEARSEDLTRLSYAENSFALILTSETLEHVPDLQAALAEIRRVLIPGGLHIFTIPMLPGVSKTFARTVVRPDGSLEHRAPQIRHPGGDTGYPVFTEFGGDFPEILERAGFEARLMFGPVRDDDLAQVWVTRKPTGS